MKDIIRDKKAEQNLFLRRALVAFLGMLILLSILIVTIYQLQVVHHDSYKTRSNGNRIKLLPIPPTRGLIYDRNDRILAENLTFWGLFITPEKTKDLTSTYNYLRKTIGLTDEDIQLFVREKSRHARYTPLLLKGNLTDEQIARFSVDQYRFPSLEIRPYFIRHYPYGESVTHILGYVGRINNRDIEQLKNQNKIASYAGTDTIGKVGLERYYEDELLGTVGFEEVEVNSRGKVVRTLRKQVANQGNSIKLSLDIDLQNYIYQLLNGRKGAVVALDPKDNSVLAMVTTPSYDNNLFVGGISHNDYSDLLKNPKRPLYSRALQGAFPPASTVKPFIAVAALQENVVTPSTTIFDPGYWVLPGTDRRYRDWLRTGHGRINLHTAVAQSSDTFFYQIAYDLGINRLSEWMKKFGFGQLTGIDISEETSGIMPDREWKQQRHKTAWLQGDTISVGIGQGYWIATPLQLAKATSILINNGKVFTPHLMKKIFGSEEKDYQDPKHYSDIEGVPADYWNFAKKAMSGVLYDRRGTARNAFTNMPYMAAGKSGTAQVFSLGADQKYDASNLSKDLHDHAWFIAYAPFDNPKIVLSIFLENAGGGSSQAAPVARSIFDYYLLSLGNLNSN